MVVLGIVAVVVVLALIGLYLWTRRSERDIEIPERVLTEDEKQQRMVAGTVITNVVGGQGGGAVG